MVLNCVPGHKTVYEATDTIVTDDTKDQLAFPEECLYTLNVNIFW